MKTKAGDRIVTLANLINLEELVKIREQKSKEVRLANWLLERKLEQGY